MAVAGEDPMPRDLVVRVADRLPEDEQSFRHPLNPRSEVHAFLLSRKAGLERVSVNLVRVPPHKESFIFHSHTSEEEWLFVISGKGVVDIGDESFELGTGDFAGFPAGSLPHHVRNPHGEDLTYLCGGESRPVEVAEFPRNALRLVRVGKEVTVYPLSAGAPLFPGAAPASKQCDPGDR